MKYFFIAISFFFILSGCGEDGESGTSTIALTSDGTITWVDLSNLGSNESYYQAGKAYPVSGPGTFSWGNAGSSWSGYAAVQAPTDGEDAPLMGLLMMDGEDGSGTAHSLYMTSGTYSFLSAELNDIERVDKGLEVEPYNHSNSVEMKPFVEP